MSSYYDGYPVSRADHVADSQRPLQRPSLASLLWRFGPPHGLRVHGVAGKPLVIDGRLQNGGQLGQDAAPIVDRGDSGLQLRYVRAQIRCRDVPEREFAEVRNDVKAYSALLVVLSLRNTASARRPVHRDAFGQRDGSITRVHELAPLLVGGCPTKPNPVN
jgi:hypothetical protein